MTRISSVRESSGDKETTDDVCSPVRVLCIDHAKHAARPMSSAGVMRALRNATIGGSSLHGCSNEHERIDD